MTAIGQAHVVALSGGVGGAKLAYGLLQALPADSLSICLNTGDDFEHLGLHISPDIDTALYTLADLANPQTGWGRRDETWTFMQALDRLGGETWFQLGDGDLATHVERTCRLARGELLSGIVSDFARRLGIRARLVPMSDSQVRTRAITDEGEFDFQDYFVRLQCRPRIQAIRYMHADAARPAPAIESVLRDPGLEAIVICPSNPYLSIDPILAVPGMRSAIRAAGVPVVAVSPIIAGEAVKGPTAKIMRELGRPASANEIAHHYAGLIDGFVLDSRDRGLADTIGCSVHIADTLMRTTDDRIRLAGETLRFARTLAATPGGRRQ